MKAVEPGRLDVRLSISALGGSAEHLAECPDLGPSCAESPPPIPYHHHVALLMSDVMADISYGLSPWMAVDARVGMRIVDTTPTYREQDGTPKLVPDDIHHHDRTIVGPSDPWLMARFGGVWGKFNTAARLGVTFPLGRTEPDPFRLGAEGKWHEHTQLGTGTFVPIVGIGASYAAESFEISASALGFFSLYENSEGFRAPSRMFGGARVAFPVLGKKLRPYASVDLAHESTEIWHGAYGLEGFNARTDLLMGAGAIWDFSEAWKVELSVKAWVHRFSSAPSFDYPGLAQVSISRSWDLIEAPKEEEEEEDHHHH